MNKQIIWLSSQLFLTLLSVVIFLLADMKKSPIAKDLGTALLYGYLTAGLVCLLAFIQIGSIIWFGIQKQMRSMWYSVACLLGECTIVLLGFILGKQLLSHL